MVVEVVDASFGIAPNVLWLTEGRDYGNEIINLKIKLC